MTPFPGLFSGGLNFSGGSISTTMQVVSSLNPFEVTASYITGHMSTDETMNQALSTRDTPGMKIYSSTLTIRLAAASAGRPLV
jgi:hypothetical protein